MVIVAVLCVFIYGFYLLLYSPLNTGINQKSSQLIEKTETLEWMKKIRQKGTSSKAKQTVDNSQLLTLLATQLKNNNTLKFPYQLQQTGSGEIQLNFDEVPFQLFMKWLAKINEKYSMTIKQLEADRSTTPGVTRLMIIISATG